MLNMVEFFLNPSDLAVYARERGLSPRELSADPAYAVHAWLDEAVGPRIVRPFVVAQLTPRIRVLGYSEETGAQLMERVGFNAPPSVASVLQGAVQSKQMPAVFKVGEEYEFEVQLLPTKKGDGKSEKDAFLIACDRSGGGAVDRFAVYTQLLAEKLLSSAAVTASQVTRYEQGSVLRKQGRTDGARASRLMQVPKATLKGRLKVTDSENFSVLLRQGVGRGSGMGFGMLMLRRAA